MKGEKRKFPSSLVKIPFVVVCLLVLAAAMPVLAAVDDWRPIDPSELALKASVVEKDADAEALFWEVRVDDGPVGQLIFTHYIRIKVFTERGRESQSKIDIPFGKIFGSNIHRGHLDTAFGHYDASYDVKDGQLVFTRKLTLRSTTIPVEQYATVRNFFERIRAVEQSPVVLARK